MYPAVRAWFEIERARGNFVDKQDLVFEFERVAAEVRDRLISEEKDRKLTPKETKMRVAIEGRLSNLSEKKHARVFLANELQRFCKARFLKPQRVMNLSLQEEKARAEATWQDFDHKVALAAFGSETELRPHVADPKDFIEHRDKLVIRASDQVPLWVMLSASRQLYGQNEYRAKIQKNKNPELQMSGQTKMSQKIGVQDADMDEEDEPKDDNDGMAQSRGQGITEQDRYRVTFEACQEIYDFFKEGEEPKGKIGKSKLVLPGAHACLSNISDDHRIIEDEAFVYGGKEWVRPAGSPVPKLMRAWVILRRENPEVRKMLEKIEVYQQPAGFVDNVVFSWMSKNQAKTCVGSVEQRDLFASPLSENGKAVSFLSHQIQTFIAGKMSAALQLTDTHFGFMIKACTR